MAAAGEGEGGGFKNLDANATSPMTAEALGAYARWAGRGDPEAPHQGGRAGRRLLRRLRQALAEEGGFELEGPRGFTVVFTGGAAEGNSHAVTAAARAFAARTRRLPHVVLGPAEPEGLLATCRALAGAGLLAFTEAAPPPAPMGGAVRRALRPNTCLVCVSAASGATGAPADLGGAAAAARGARVPLHCDASQTLGRWAGAPRPAALGAASLALSFHRLGGPPGVGALALRNDFLAGYGLGPLVGGPQNGGLRGGLENVPALAGALAALRRAAAGRAEKDRRAGALRDGLRAALARRLGGEPAWLSPAGGAPHTLTFAVRGGAFCARAAREALAAKGLAVGAPFAGPDGPRLGAGEGVPPGLWGRALRVSLPDGAGAEDLEEFARELGALAARRGGSPPA